MIEHKESRIPLFSVQLGDIGFQQVIAIQRDSEITEDEINTILLELLRQRLFPNESWLYLLSRNLRYRKRNEIDEKDESETRPPEENT